MSHFTDNHSQWLDSAVPAPEQRPAQPLIGRDDPCTCKGPLYPRWNDRLDREEHEPTCLNWKSEPSRVPIEIAQVSNQFMVTAQRLPTLFDLEDAAYQLMARLEDNDAGDNDVADLVLIDQMILEKVESYCSVIRSLEAMSAARKVEADRLRERAASATKHAEWLKTRLLVHLQTTGRQRIEMSRFSVSIRTNPPNVNVLDAALVPSKYTRTKITVDVDKHAVLDAFKHNGEIIPGTEVSREERLDIR